MKKAFTLIELLVVIAIIAILAALLMPALSRARKEAMKSSCRNNVHNVGIGMALFVQDNNGVYPGWATRTSYVTGSNGAYWATRKGAVDTNGDWAYQLISKKYLDNVQLFHCPNVQPLLRGDWVGVRVYDYASGFSSDVAGGSFRAPGNTGSNDIGDVCFNEMEYDLGRISRDSVAGRGIFGDGWERWWNWFDDSGWFPYNHSDGSNLLFVDNAVQFAPLQDEFNFSWSVYSSQGGDGNWYRKAPFRILARMRTRGWRRASACWRRAHVSERPRRHLRGRGQSEHVRVDDVRRRAKAAPRRRLEQQLPFGGAGFLGRPAARLSRVELAAGLLPRGRRVCARKPVGQV